MTLLTLTPNSTCIEFQPLQIAFLELYDINSYKNWHYDHGLGVFEFKNGNGPDIYFKYAEVGSFSTKANTWMWAWDNESVPTLVKRPLKKVKTHGEINNYDQMATGLIDGDEYTGWSMTAITAKLLNAIGGYRVPSDHLFVYFVFLNQITEDEFDVIKQNTIECYEHASARMAFVCTHLIQADKKGFNEVFDSDEAIGPNDNYQAWCDDCEQLWLQERELNDAVKTFADMKAVCEECYFKIRDRN